MFPFKSSPIGACDAEQVRVHDRVSFVAAAQVAAAHSVSPSAHTVRPVQV